MFQETTWTVGWRSSTARDPGRTPWRGSCRWGPRWPWWSGSTTNSVNIPRQLQTISSITSNQIMSRSGSGDTDRGDNFHFPLITAGTRRPGVTVTPGGNNLLSIQWWWRENNWTIDVIIFIINFILECWAKYFPLGLTLRHGDMLCLLGRVSLSHHTSRCM